MADRRDPLEGVERLVVDGTNVLHALRRSAVPLPSAALIGRLRAVVPPPVSIVVVLDGSPEHGLVARHVASGVQVHYAGRESADAVIARLASSRGPEAATTMLVVTDDTELTFAARRAGARTVRNSWLLARLAQQRLAAPATGARQTPPPRNPDAGRDGDGDAESAAARWAPGRGATRKRGNPRRSPKH